MSDPKQPRDTELSASAAESLDRFDFDSDDDRWMDHLRESESPASLGSVGDYEIIEEISRGGQGVVYRARQPGTNRDVALKRLHAGIFASASARRRFEREVETAASLNHPNIVTAFGIDIIDREPLFSMEWIDGISVTEWAVRTRNESRLVKRVSSMMAKICDAVQHAHQRGVIHRDLKPSNILVDAEAEPHILDFGLAKSIGSDQTGPDAMTLTQHFVGTPAYASPEHVRSSSEVLDTRADVYSLGVILYEMLTGKMPYKVQGDLPDVFEAISREEPKRPSVVSNDIGRELEAVVLKALAKDRELRYQSAADFAADLRRFVGGEPVEAHPPSTMYQLRVLVRRHRVPVMFACSLILVLAAAATVATLQAFQIARERDRAQLEARKSRAVSDFLLGIVSSPNPELEGRDIRVLDMLAHASDRVRDSFEDQPELRLELHRTLARMYTKLGEYDAAESHLERASAVASEHFANDLEVVDTILHTRGDLLTATGRWDDAVAAYRKCVSHGMGVPDPSESRYFSTWNNLAGVFIRQREFEDAERILRTLLSVYEISDDDSAELELTTLNNLAQLLREAGRLRESVPILRDVLDRQRVALREDHPDRLTTMTNLGDVLGVLGETSEGIALLKNAIEGRKRVLGEEHPDTIESMNNLAQAYEAEGRAMEARPLLEKALEVNRRVLGNDHPNTLGAINNLALWNKRQRNFDRALELYTEVAEGTQRVLGKEHTYSMSAKSNLMGVYCSLDRAEEAVAIGEEIVRTAREALPAGHWMIGAIQNAYGFALLETKRFEEAEREFSSALQILRSVYGDDHSSTKTCARNLQRARSLLRNTQVPETTDSKSPAQP